jgi:hypothetical protein
LVNERVLATRVSTTGSCSCESSDRGSVWSCGRE